MTIFIILIISFIVILGIPSSVDNAKKKNIQKAKAEKEREYQEWYEKLQKSKLFEETVAKLFSKGLPYKLHFGYRNVNYTYDGRWDKYKQRTYPPLGSDEALKAFVDLILEKYPYKYRKEIEYETDGEGFTTNHIQCINLTGTWSLPVSLPVDPWAKENR